MLIFGWNFIRPEYFLKSDSKLNENGSIKDISIYVKNNLLDMLKIANLNLYEKVAAEFENFFHQKIDMHIIRHSENTHFLSP